MERDKLLGTMDAKVWTDEFMATKARLGDEEFDHAMMLAWFANAIMAGFDEANRCAQRALDAAQARVKELELYLTQERANRDSLAACVDRDVKKIKELQAQLAALTTAHQSWTKVLGEWLWNCTNLLGDYHIKTVQDFNEEVNRRIAWLMQHLDYTLPPPMTDEERDRMRKLSEDNAALQADNECKDSLIETLQAQLADRDAMILQMGEQAAVLAKENMAVKAQLRQVEHDAETYRKMHAVCTMNLALANNDLTTLRQLMEVHTKQLTELTIIPIGCSREQELRWTQSIKDLRATLAAKDAGKGA